MKPIIAEVVYLSGKRKRSCYKSFIVKDRDTLNSLVSFVTDSRYLVLTVRYYEDSSYALSDAYSIFKK